MKKELKVISNLYSDPDELGHQICIKRNIITRQEIEIDNILSHSEIFNSKGKVLKSQCMLIIDKVGTLVVKHSFDYIQNLKSGQYNYSEIGFKYKKKK